MSVAAKIHPDECKASHAMPKMQDGKSRKLHLLRALPRAAEVHLSRLQARAITRRKMRKVRGGFCQICGDAGLSRPRMRRRRSARKLKGAPPSSSNCLPSHYRRALTDQVFVGRGARRVALAVPQRLSPRKLSSGLTEEIYLLLRLAGNIPFGLGHQFLGLRHVVQRFQHQRIFGDTDSVGFSSRRRSSPPTGCGCGS